VADDEAPDVGIPEELAKFYFAQICEGMVSLPIRICDLS
jgi:hypothetical protein